MRIRGKKTARPGRPFRAKVIGSVVAISAASLAALPVVASATTSTPYTSGAYGYDVSWPNCSTTAPSGSTTNNLIPPASSPSFAIVGITDGRPFTTSSCAGTEYSAASSLGTPSLYFNTGYAGAYAHNIVSACTSAVGTAAGSSTTDPFPSGLKGHQLTQAEQAWEIGCSEAQYGVTHDPGGTNGAAFWWADVETGNSWSTNVSLNQYTIDGMSYAMNFSLTTGSASSVGGGVYSNPGSWNKLTGSNTWAPTPAVPTWVAGGTCNASGFAGITPTLVQNFQWTTNGPVDGDTAC